MNIYWICYKFCRTRQQDLYPRRTYLQVRSSYYWNVGGWVSDSWLLSTAWCKSTKRYVLRSQWLCTTYFQNLLSTEHEQQALGPLWTTIKARAKYQSSRTWSVPPNFGINCPLQLEMPTMSDSSNFSWRIGSMWMLLSNQIILFSLFYMWTKYVILIYRRK